jgi:hypothetical protein
MQFVNDFYSFVIKQYIMQNEENQRDQDDDGWEDCNFDGGADDHDDEPIVDGNIHGTMADFQEIEIPHNEKETDSYEELVTKRVAAYVQQSQQYIESTDLAKKVSKWHEDIRPKLEKVEKRGNFDIHK